MFMFDHNVDGGPKSWLPSIKLVYELFEDGLVIVYHYDFQVEIVFQ